MKALTLLNNNNIIVKPIEHAQLTLSDAAIEKINERMPEIYRATKAFGRSNSPVENKLMSLSIISHSPYKRLKQCLAEIEKKRTALKEHYFELAKKRNNLKRLEYKLENEKLDEFERTDIQIEIAKIKSDINDIIVYVDGALKSIADFQDAYEQIKKTYNIPDNWTEEDYVKAELEHHIKTAYIQGIRDVLMTGRLNIGNMEYFEQYGINPVIAFKEIINYINNLNEDATIDELYEFVDSMYDRHKNDVKKAMDRVGITELYNKLFIYTGE